MESKYNLFSLVHSLFFKLFPSTANRSFPFLQYTDDVLPELGESGVQNLVVVPISFVSEHIETLEEIDIEYRELAEESGVSNWRRCPAPNTDPTFIEDMADMVFEALHEPAQTVTETCIANNIEGIDLTALDDSVAVSAGGVGGVGADGDLYKIK